MEHFLSICCFGGEPFADFHQNTTIDPTDWSADVLKDYNSSQLLPEVARNIDLAHCQVFNITFTNQADQMLFDTYKANFLCRCPFGRSGQFCQSSSPLSLPLSSHPTLSPHQPIMMLLVIAAVVLALMAVLAMMVKGCFCDCFGPFTREDPYDKPLDPEDVRSCLQKVRENQAAREMVSQPLVSHPPPPPMVSDSYSAPYPPTGYPSAPPMNYRPPSPPPAYSAIDKVPSTQI